MRIHFAGGGQCAEYIAKRLIREGHDLVIVERDEARCRQLEETLDANIIQGDIVHLPVWRESELASTDLFVACTHSDSANISASLVAQDFAPQALKVIRLRNPDYAEWQRILDDLGVRIDRIVHPETDIVNRILRVLTIPGVADVRDFLDGKARVFSMNIERNHPFVGHRINDFKAIEGSEHSRICLLLKGTRAIVPRGDERIEVDDHLYIATTDARLEQTMAFFGITRRERLHSVFIVGGGEIGLTLAKALEAQKVKVKLFEQDKQRAELLASELRDTVVLNLNGIEQDVLLRENIEGADAYVALTGDDDDNLIACLLARRLGVDKVVPLLNRINYLPLAQRLGINTTVSPRIKSADALLEFIRKGGVQSVRTLGEEQAEAIELVTPPGAAYVNMPLCAVNFPDGVRVAVIADHAGEVRIANGDSVIQPGEKVVIFAQEGAIRKLEASLLNQPVIQT